MVMEEGIAWLIANPDFFFKGKILPHFFIESVNNLPKAAVTKFSSLPAPSL